MSQSADEVFWAEPLNLSPSQAASAATLRKHLRTEGQLLEDHSDDVTMCRFLRARKWDVPKAQLMYTNMVQWRGTLQLDHPDHEFHFPEEHLVKQHYPHFYHKTDKFGRPIYYELLGEMNATELLKATSVERLVRYHVHCRERTMRDIMPACSNAVGRRVFTCVTILDLKGVSGAAFNSAVRAFLREVSQLDQENYPEMLGTMFVVNAPLIFTGIWALVKLMLEARTVKKIQVLSSDKKATKALLAVIDKEHLLERFGGECALSAPYTNACGPWSDGAAFEKMSRSELHCTSDGDALIPSSTLGMA